MTTHTFDVAVLGAGIAGLTAARVAAEGGATTLLIDRIGVGGQVSTVDRITNAPGFTEPIAGYDMGVELLDDAEEAGVALALDDITSITVIDGGFRISGADTAHEARSVILAQGSTRRALGVPGEEDLDGRGVSHCASCDGYFFTGKRVVVVGGGDSAFDEANVLAEHAAEIALVYRDDAPAARPSAIAEVRARPNVVERPRSTVTAVHGDDRVASVTLKDLTAGDVTDFDTDGLFVYVGLQPNTEWLASLVELDSAGRIRVDDALRTTSDGVFAAGDIRVGTASTLAEASVDGEIAARAALERHRALGADQSPASS